MFLVDLITKFVLWTKRNHVVKPKGRGIEVNLGSGLSVAEGWTNVDSDIHALFSKLPRWFLQVLWKISTDVKKRYSKEEYCNILKDHIFVYHNLEYGIPFPDESIDYLYSSHLLEHMYKEDAMKFLKEAYRVCKRSGIFRICVPDLEYAISLYQKGDKQKALDFFFTPSESGYFSRHKYMYDFDLLKQLLEKVGFTSIERCSYKWGQCPDIDILDNRPEETLYVEARKAVSRK